MDALALLDTYRGRKITVFPASEQVPLDGVVRDDWQALVQDDKHGGAVNRISYEWCVLTTLREKVRCKEVWVQGAHRFRNPDEDVPRDFNVRRDEYYAALAQSREARVFVEHARRTMEAALTALNASLPADGDWEKVGEFRQPEAHPAPWRLHQTRRTNGRRCCVAPR
jgi:hypothetical protein